jgi:hypothetical protein
MKRKLFSSYGDLVTPTIESFPEPDQFQDAFPFTNLHSLHAGVLCGNEFNLKYTRFIFILIFIKSIVLLKFPME